MPTSVNIKIVFIEKSSPFQQIGVALLGDVYPDYDKVVPEEWNVVLITTCFSLVIMSYTCPGKYYS